MKALLPLFLLTSVSLFGCGADTPAPDYPFPVVVPLEDTELAQFLPGGEEDGEDDYAEDEEWDDGLDGVDLSMDDTSGGSDDAAAESPE